MNNLLTECVGVLIQFHKKYYYVKQKLFQNRGSTTGCCDVWLTFPKFFFIPSVNWFACSLHGITCQRAVQDRIRCIVWKSCILGHHRSRRHQEEWKIKPENENGKSRYYSRLRRGQESKTISVNRARYIRGAHKTKQKLLLNILIMSAALCINLKQFFYIYACATGGPCVPMYSR